MYLIENYFKDENYLNEENSELYFEILFHFEKLIFLLVFYCIFTKYPIFINNKVYFLFRFFNFL